MVRCGGNCLQSYYMKSGQVVDRLNINGGWVMVIAMIQGYRFVVEAPNIIGCIEES